MLCLARIHECWLEMPRQWLMRMADSLPKSKDTHAANSSAAPPQTAEKRIGSVPLSFSEGKFQPATFELSSAVVEIE